MSNQCSNLGLIGLAVMGANLARNIADKGFSVSVYNRTYDRTRAFMQEYGQSKLRAYEQLADFIISLSQPRAIIMMIQAGAVDEQIRQLLPLLEAGDMLIDCGNSDYRDTARRSRELSSLGIYFFGCGVSGGEEGALHGPSLMPGGDKIVYERLSPVFRAIAASDFHGRPCVSYMGGEGAGHFVKMVHNGIEYAMMQMMSEVWLLLADFYQLEAPEIADIFADFQKGRLESFLFETAVRVLRQKDEFQLGYAIDYILDVAAQKGTGRQTAIEALEHGSDASSISAAVFARISSVNQNIRQKMARQFPRSSIELPELSVLLPKIENALYVGMLLAYEEGFSLLAKLSDQHQWRLNFSEIARIWQGGCIIRSRILSSLETGFQGQGRSLKEIDSIAEALSAGIADLRTVVSLSVNGGLPFYSLSGALMAFDGSTIARGSAAFIQALRDCFGAHGYQRSDQEGFFHTHWDELSG